MNFSFLARTFSNKKNFAILSGNPIVPAIEGNHRRRIATALSSYEPVSVENNQSWTLKQERKFFMKLLLCYDTFDPFNQNNSIHMSLSASKITKFGHSSKKGKYCECNEKLYETVSLLWYIWSMCLINNIYADGLTQCNAMQGQFSCSGVAGKQTWLKIRAQSTSIFLSTFTFQKHKDALWRLNLVLYRSKQN